MPNTCSKYADETLRVTFDYATIVTRTNDPLNTGIAPTITQITGTGLTFGTAIRGTSSVLVPVSGGTAGQTYVIGCLATTQAGALLRINGTLTILAAATAY